MKFLSLDLETTGLDPDYCQILEIGAVVGDLSETPVEDLPSFHCYVYHGQIVGETYALAMNQRILRELANGGGHPVYDAWSVLQKFLGQHFDLCVDRITLAGKNVMSFDLPFLRKLPGFAKNVFHHRALDPGSMFWLPGDTEVPSTETCFARCNMTTENQHIALADARDVVRLIRAHHSWMERGVLTI